MRELFYPGSLKGRALRRMILSGIVRGETVNLEEEAIALLEKELSASLGEDVSLVFYVGTPGAYRKVTAQALGPGSKTLGFAKIAATPPTVRDVEAEHGILGRLAGNHELDGRVPRALGLFDWRGARVLLTTGGPPQPGPRRPSGEHLDFCARLFLPFREETAFGESQMLVRAAEKVGYLGTRLPDASGLFQRALEHLRAGLGPVSCPLSMAHRDFAPWNTRVGSRGLFVFDWDGARRDMPPLYDLFHFQSIQAALRGKREPLPERRLLHESLEVLWPEGHGHLSSLYLAYLLDLSLHYGEARAAAPDAGDARVYDWLLSRMQALLDREPKI